MRRLSHSPIGFVSLKPQIKPAASEELASIGQVGQTPGLQPDPPVGFGRASGPPVVPSPSRAPAQVKAEQPATENWLRLVNLAITTRRATGRQFPGTMGVS